MFDNVRRYNFFKDGRDQGYLALQKSVIRGGLKGMAAGVVSLVLLALSAFSGSADGWKELVAGIAIGGYALSCLIESAITHNTLHLMDWIDATNDPDRK